MSTESQNPKSIIKSKAGDIVLTWIRTDDVENCTPCNQVYGIIFNKQKEILLIKEKGSWKIPGGTPEAGETKPEALERELMEEASITVSQITPLGVQQVEHPNNPDEDVGDTFYQYRYVCLLDEKLQPTPDPDTGEIYDRMLVPADKVTEYVLWGASGNAMFADAIELYEKKLINHQ